MKTSHLAFVLVWLFCPLCQAQAFQAASNSSLSPLPRLTILTEDYGPFNYLDGTALQGFSTELVRLILLELGSDISQHDQQVMPWARAYQIALVRPNTLLYTVTHTEQRDMLFRWVGPLVHTRVAIVAKKSRKLRTDDLNQLAGLLIGTIRDDVGEQLLVEKGFPLRNIVSNTSASYVVEMLRMDRIDALAHGEIASNWYLSRIGEKLEDYEVIHTLQRSFQYLVFSRSTGKELVDRFQEAFMRIKLSDRYQALIDKYPAISYSLATGLAQADVASRDVTPQRR
ncbi:substrate-binding periplasmic protein [Bowmanella dokdonensis]|uniref:Transporter substrate-binding domain-containing protein n=1 Tax=Bowmanella dokdonensis TaxID=751969 RepID=A0A939DMQ9_9ALTE|nr:transporter substrate-binding domain-containing protein [Bowmanella dokdonensis]MBN7825429.1 transporter substrate-binding domain-containing protein [Bowmanella dokdonensis]